jgi:hypothetical protein
MRKMLKYVIPGLVLAAGVFLTPQKSAANPDFTKRTAKKCVYCHIGDWGSGKFTDAGIYYKDHATFKGYVPKEQSPQQNSGTQSKDKDKDKTQQKAASGG